MVCCELIGVLSGQVVAIYDEVRAREQALEQPEVGLHIDSVCTDQTVTKCGKHEFVRFSKYLVAVTAHEPTRRMCGVVIQWHLQEKESPWEMDDGWATENTRHRARKYGVGGIVCQGSRD